MAQINPTHPLSQLIHNYVEEEFTTHVASSGHDHLKLYLTNLLINFVRTENIFAIKDPLGTPLKTIFEMLAEADVRMNATSFERERQVHKHIGDFILFWSGINPKYLSQIRINNPLEFTCNYNQQAKQSYQIVSSFTHPPFHHEVKTYQDLSQGFEDLTFVLRSVAVRANLVA